MIKLSTIIRITDQRLGGTPTEGARSLHFLQTSGGGNLRKTTLPHSIFRETVRKRKALEFILENPNALYFAVLTLLILILDQSKFSYQYIFPIAECKCFFWQMEGLEQFHERVVCKYCFLHYTIGIDVVDYSVQ
jgi:hypothetical protein